MSELETAILNLLKANPSIILDVLKENYVQCKRLEVVMDDADTGRPISYRKASDLDSRFAISQNLDGTGNNTDQFATLMMGNGTDAPWHSFGLINVYDTITGEARNLLEFNSRNKDGTTGNNIGVVFNTRDGHSISMTAEHGEIIVRDEVKGHEPIAVIK